MPRPDRARGLAAAAAIAGILLACPLPAADDGSDPRPPASAAAAEMQALYSPVPPLELTLSDGRRTTLEALARERPVVLTLFFARCPLVCRPYVRQLAAAAGRVGGAGTDYQVIAVSFDPRDDPAALRAFAASLGLDGAPGWGFAVAGADELRAAADRLGFWYSWDPAAGGFDHATLVVGIAQGRVLDAIAGNGIDPARFAALASTLRGDPWRSTRNTKAASFRCFSFDPATGAAVPDWGMLILAVPGAFALVVAGSLFRAGARRGRTAATHTRWPGTV
ncbi:MAG: hypothetical protein QG573_3014 [Acidobacteriota bacterium]|nr:hypothetical protein [Acidobacteriota bacterium]